MIQKLTKIKIANRRSSAQTANSEEDNIVKICRAM